MKWWLKVISNFNDEIKYRDTISVCQIFWTSIFAIGAFLFIGLLFGVVLLVGVSSIIGLLFIIFGNYYDFFTIFSPDYIEFCDISVIIVSIGVLLPMYVLNRDYILEQNKTMHTVVNVLNNTKNTDTKETTPPLLYVMYKSFKDKTCFLVDLNKYRN